MSQLALGTDTPGGIAGGVLVIGYGNALRSDDAVGLRVANLLADDPRLAGVEVGASHQLTPELALDMSRASLVILIDASTEGQPGAITVRPLKAADTEAADHRPGAMSHHVAADVLLAIARDLYGATPRAFVVSVGTATMDVGEKLSPPVAAALPAIVDAVANLVEAHRRSRAPSDGTG